MIYFIRCALTSRVKIGFSEKPWLRLNKMQADCPTQLQLAAIVEGDKVAEAALHQRFSEQRVRGEWFSETGSLKAFIATLDEAMRPTGTRRVRRALATTKLGAWIAANDMTDLDVSRATGISRPTICRLRHGKRYPGVAVARKLAALTGMTWEELFFEAAA